MRISPFVTFIITGSVLLVIIAILGFIFIYISNNVSSTRNELGRTVTEISLMEENQTRLTRMSDLLQERKSDITRLTNLSVNRDRPLQFIERIEQIGHLTNTILSLNIDEARGTSESLMFRASIDGSETGVRNMLRLIEALPYQITIENMAFQREPNLDAASLKPNSHLNISMRVKAQQ